MAVSWCCSWTTASSACLPTVTAQPRTCGSGVAPRSWLCPDLSFLYPLPPVPVETVALATRGVLYKFAVAGDPGLLMRAGLADFHGLASASRPAPSGTAPAPKQQQAEELANRHTHCAGAAEAQSPSDGPARVTVLRRRRGGLADGGDACASPASGASPLRGASPPKGTSPPREPPSVSPHKGPAITCADIVYALSEHPAGMSPEVLKAYVASHLHDDRSSQASYVMA